MVKNATWVTLCVGMALTGFLVLGAAPADEKEPAKTQKESKKKGPVADNQACFVCHANYDEEEMADQHAKANVACTECHGQSAAHRNDENNITPPDRMYPLAAIDPGCVKCHETHDAPARKVIARSQERSLAQKDPKELVCTDCHGDHRLKYRTVRWDKQTGKLIPNAASPTGTTAGESQAKAPQKP